MEMLEMLLGGLIMLISYVSALAYIPLQVYTGIRWRGLWRIMALVPMLLMVPVFAFTGYALTQESNLWPLLLIFAAPVGTGYLVILMVSRRLVNRPPNNSIGSSLLGGFIAGIVAFAGMLIFYRIYVPTASPDIRGWELFVSVILSLAAAMVGLVIGAVFWIFRVSRVAGR